MGFYVAYQVARGAADRSVAHAFQNGETVLRTENGLGALFEPAVQRVVDTSTILVTLTSYTYWLSQFAVVGLALLWIYIYRYPAFLRVRDTVIVANTIGLLGYVLVPTAPPRLLPGDEFVDTMASSPLNHATELVRLAGNPYAAMPSLHAADALIVGVSLALLVRPLWLKALWLLWPCWVAFALIASGNHFWLDVAVGAALAVVSVEITGWLERRFRGAGAVAGQPEGSPRGGCG